MQTAVTRDNYKYSRGECYRYSAIKKLVDDLMPIENIGFGLGVVRGPTARTCRLPYMNSYVGTLSADMVGGGTANLVGYTLTNDGTQDAFSIAVPFNTSQAQTATDIKTAIEAAATDVVVTISNSNRTFTVVASNGKRLVITTPFTRSGSGTATFTNTKGTTDTIRGITERDFNAFYAFNLTNETLPVWPANKGMAGIIYQGDPACVVNTTVAAGDPVYCLLEDYTDQASVLNVRGSFRNDTDGGLAPVVLVSGAEFGDVAEDGLAPVAILKP